MPCFRLFYVCGNGGRIGTKARNQTDKSRSAESVFKPCPLLRRHPSTDNMKNGGKNETTVIWFDDGLVLGVVPDTDASLCNQ